MQFRQAAIEGKMCLTPLFTDQNNQIGLGQGTVCLSVPDLAVVYARIEVLCASHVSFIGQSNSI